MKSIFGVTATGDTCTAHCTTNCTVSVTCASGGCSAQDAGPGSEGYACCSAEGSIKQACDSTSSSYSCN